MPDLSTVDARCKDCFPADKQSVREAEDQEAASSSDVIVRELLGGGGALYPRSLLRDVAFCGHVAAFLSMIGMRT